MGKDKATKMLWSWVCKKVVAKGYGGCWIYYYIHRSFRPGASAAVLS